MRRHRERETVDESDHELIFQKLEAITTHIIEAPCCCPNYLSMDGPWFTKFNGIDPAWNVHHMYKHHLDAFYKADHRHGTFPAHIRDRIMKFGDYPHANRIAGEIAFKSDQRRLLNVIKRTRRVYADSWQQLVQGEGWDIDDSTDLIRR
jgi:hypothetical protein